MENPSVPLGAEKKLISVGNLFKKSFEFYKSKLYIIVVLALIPFANFVIISLLMEVSGAQKSDWVFVSGFGFLILLFFLFFLVLNFWVQITFFYVIKQKDLLTDAKSLLAFSWPKIYSYSWVLLLMAIINAVGFLLLIIPGIIFSIWFSLSLYVFIFEDIKGMPALYKSKELVKGYWWPVFGRLLVFGFCAALISATPVIGELVNIFFMMPLGIIYGYYIYADLKAIKSL